MQLCYYMIIMRLWRANMIRITMSSWFYIKHLSSNNYLTCFDYFPMWENNKDMTEKTKELMTDFKMLILLNER